MDQFIPRALEKTLKRAVSEFPAVVLTGPRQSGKTTLLKHIFGRSHGYVSLEPPDVRAAAVEDPRGFLAAYRPPVILDEVQYAPDLLAYVKEDVDAHRDESGRYVLTGSQNLLVSERISETLAGRAAMLRLLPLSMREIAGEPARSLPWERGDESVNPIEIGDLWKVFLRGSYPELAARPDRDPSLWHSSYIQTYLERDVRTIRQIGDLVQFQAFLRMLAARSGQLLQMSDLGRDLGVAVNTIKAWISVLEATYQIIVLRPYFANIGTRLIKTPKIYFSDVGTLCFLVGLKDPAHAAAGPMGGPIFETAVISEVLKTLVSRGTEPELYFWRTSAGSEVDLLVRHETGLVPLEVKLSATPRPRSAASIRAFQTAIERSKQPMDRSLPGFVIHPGDVSLPLGEDVRALPFSSL